MSYEPHFERFEAAAPGGELHVAEFRRAGFLSVGDYPEVYFFGVDGEEVVVAISGGALRRFQQGRRSLSREEKIDLAGLFLRRRIEAGTPLRSENLLLRDEELARTAGELGFPA